MHPRPEYQESGGKSPRAFSDSRYLLIDQSHAEDAGHPEKIMLETVMRVHSGRCKA